MKHLVVILTSIVTLASIVAGCANYAYSPRAKHEKQYKPRHHVSRLASKVIHPKTEPTPDLNTYGHAYIVSPDGSWHWLEDPSPIPTPSPLSARKPQSF